MTSVWFLYVLRCADGSLYTGISTNPTDRLAAHNSGRGAKYTRSRRPVSIEAQVVIGTKSQALKLEYRFKQLTRAQKLVHVKNGLANFVAQHASYVT